MFSKKSQDIKVEYERIQEFLDCFDCKFIYSGFFKNNDCDFDVNMRELYIQFLKFNYFFCFVVLFGCFGLGKIVMMVQVVKEFKNWFFNLVSVVCFFGIFLFFFLIKDVFYLICVQILVVYKINIFFYIDLEKDY